MLRGELPARVTAPAPGHRGDHRVADRNERHHEQRPRDTCDSGPGSDRQDDGQRVDGDGATEQERLQPVGLHLLHHQDDTEHQQRDERALRDERHEHGEDPGQQRPHDGDERPQEHHHPEGHRQRHPEQRRTDTDAEPVDDGDHQRRPYVVAQRHPPRAARLVQRLPGAPWQQPQQPGPDPVSRRQEEKRREQRDEQSFGDLRRRRRHAQCTAQQRAAVARCGGLRPPDGIRQSGRRQVQRAVGEALLQVAGTRDSLRTQVAEATGGLLPDQREQRSDEQQREQHAGQRRHRPGDPRSRDQPHQRVEQRSQQQRHQDRDQDVGEAGQQPDDAVQAQRNDQQAPGPVRGDTDGRVDAGRGGGRRRARAQVGAALGRGRSQGHDRAMPGRVAIERSGQQRR